MYQLKWMLLLSCLSLTACTSTPESAQTAEAKSANTAPATVTVVKAYNKDTDKSALLCRKEKVLGSNRSVKVCKTVAQQDEERKQAENMVNDRSLQQSLGGGGSGR
jgi:hypothetical protein